MRKLASIQVVNAAEPIANADAIERIRVLGSVGGRQERVRPAGRESCLLRDRLPFSRNVRKLEFLRLSSFKQAIIDDAGVTIQPAGFRIKTVKLRGQVSQGICFPLSILPPGIDSRRKGAMSPKLCPYSNGNLLFPLEWVEGSRADSPVSFQNR